MIREEFLNIFSFIQLCDNKTYVKRGQEQMTQEKSWGSFTNISHLNYQKYGGHVNTCLLIKDVYLSKDEFISGVITQAKLKNTT